MGASGNGSQSGSDPSVNLNFKDRTFERRRGCWNCIRWNNQGLAVGKWTADRQVNLAEALRISMNHPDGQDAAPVVNLRRMVDNLDHSIARGEFGICLGGHSETDYCHNAFLCDRWTGKDGSSVATSGAPLDLLPEELKDKVDG